MIKNLRIFRNPKIKMRLCSLALAGVMGLGCLVGCSSEHSENVLSDSGYEQSANQEVKKIFEVGDHIITVPVEDPTSEVRQYDYHEGYKCVGLGTSVYGDFYSIFGNAYALYINEYAVECTATGLDSNNIPVYDAFGTPIDYEKREEKTTAETKDFGIGEHIISVPIDSPGGSNMQYRSYEGYEAVDVTVAEYGRYFSYYGGGAILYVNIVPVRCEVTSYDDNNKGIYLSFGTPIEAEKVLEK